MILLLKRPSSPTAPAVVIQQPSTRINESTIRRINPARSAYPTGVSQWAKAGSSPLSSRATASCKRRVKGPGT
jgi:hypothetical protein